MANPICLRLLLHFMRLAASRIFWTAGRSRPIRIAMIAITTSSSIRVNPRRVRRRERKVVITTPGENDARRMRKTIPDCVASFRGSALGTSGAWDLFLLRTLNPEGCGIVPPAAASPRQSEVTPPIHNFPNYPDTNADDWGGQVVSAIFRFRLRLRLRPRQTRQRPGHGAPPGGRGRSAGPVAATGPPP